VRGAINAAWDKLGGSAGQLGVPAEDEVYRGDVVSQKFTAGELSWNRKDKTFTTVPPELAGQLGDVVVPEDPASAIAAARRAAGGALGPLGEADGEQYSVGDQGVAQNYAGGKIFYSPATGANVVSGQVLEKYESVGGPQGDLGFPTSSETDGGLGSNSRVSAFSAEDRPVIFWTPDYGPVIVRGAMNAAWSKLDAAKGPLGAPMADATENGSVVTQRFSGGVLKYDRTTRKFSTEPANLSTQLAGLDVPGEDVPQNTSGPQSSAADDSTGLLGWKWNWWWLLALIPLLLLAGLAVGATVRNRRRGRTDNRFADDDFFAASNAPDHVDRGADDESRYAPVGAGTHDAGDAETSTYAGGYGDYSPPSAFDDAARQDPDPDATDMWDLRDEPAHEPVDGDHQFAPAAPGDTADVEEEDPDSIDTAPTRIETDEPPMAAMFVDDAPSGRHAAIDVDEPAPGRTAIHLAVDGSGEPPQGYPIKADTRSGVYWAPNSPQYHDAVAEIWFASEEFARTNGFVRAD